MKVPPFVSRADYIEDRRSDRDAANRWATIIRQAWRKVGHEVEAVVIERRGKDGSIVGYDVRTPTLVNGLPTKRVLADG